LVACLLLVVGAVVVLLIREPSEAAPTSLTKKGHKGKKWDGISLSAALRQPYFYAAAGCVFLTGLSLQGINGIAAAHLGDVGIDKSIVATALSIHSVALCISKLLSGVSYDKLGLRVTLLICEVLGMFSFLALAFSGNDPLGVTSAVVWSVLSALAMPLETVMVPLIAADMFGEKDFSKMVGIFVSINTAGYAFGTPIANLIFDQFGTYKPMLFLTAILMLMIAVSFYFIINVAERVRTQVMQTPNSVNTLAEGE
jgi:MFS family permease